MAEEDEVDPSPPPLQCAHVAISSDLFSFRLTFSRFLAQQEPVLSTATIFVVNFSRLSFCRGKLKTVLRIRDTAPF